MFKLDFRQRAIFVYGLLSFILGLTVSHIDDVIYSVVALFIGIIVIDIIFDKYVMNNVMVIEVEKEQIKDE